MTSLSWEDAFGRALHKPETQTAIAMLAEAASFAAELTCDAWEFAIELADFHAAGVSSTTLRWMLKNTLIEHAVETTPAHHPRRTFKQVPNLKFGRRSCFAFSPASLAHRDQLQRSDRSAEQVVLPGRLQDAPGNLPSWDFNKRELRVGRVLIKQFKQPALDQITILNAFQEDGWPACIDDPLAPQLHQDSKRRLHNTISNLNRNQRARLIRFYGNGSGAAIGWELVDPSDTTATPKLM
jgi:hypothetical protein